MPKHGQPAKRFYKDITDTEKAYINEHASRQYVTDIAKHLSIEEFRIRRYMSESGISGYDAPSKRPKSTVKRGFFNVDAVKLTSGRKADSWIF